MQIQVLYISHLIYLYISCKSSSYIYKYIHVLNMNLDIKPC